MNFLKQSLQRCRFNQTIPFNIFRYITTLPNPKESVEENAAIQNEEIDKLYKTVELELKGNEPGVLRSYVKFATMAGQHFGLEVKSWNMRKAVHERYTVLKCVHIYKKHRVQYEHRTYFMWVQYKRLTGSTADTLLEYLERNLPEGVALKATKIEIQKLPEYFKPPEKSESTI